MIAFDHPATLLLLVALAALAWWHFSAQARGRARALAYSSLAAVTPFARDVSLLAGTLRVLPYAAMALLIVALAGPSALVPRPLHDATAILCIDTSGSMGAGDFRPTRWAAARAAARRFIDGVPQGTRLGIVAFSSSAQVVLLPTRQRAQQYAALDRIPQPNGATAIGAALVTAASLFPHRGHHAIVLLTDGVNNRPPDPQRVAREVGRTGIVIDTVGIGLSDTTATIPGTNELAGLDAPGLQAIAAAAGGSYAQVSNSGELAGAFARVARAVTWERVRLPLTHACVLGALGLLALGALARAMLLRG